MDNANKLIIATRGSKLALWQANHISALLRSEHPGLGVELSIIKTKGDKILDVPLAQVGGKGLFVKEIEDALLNGQADLAVHSFKDVPVEQPAGLRLGATPPREDVADMLLSLRFEGLAGLPVKARIGTSSLRRKAQLLALRQDLEIVDLRGNLDTRVRKLMDGEFDAVVVAAAGLSRLGLGAPKQSRLAPPEFLPAVGQGALCLELRENDNRVAELTAFLDCPDTRDCVAGERGFLTGLDGGCQAPIAAFARLLGPGEIEVTGLVCDLDGSKPFRASQRGPREEAFALGRSLAAQVLEAGAKDILSRFYQHHEA